MSKSALIFLAPGAEDLELVVLVDILRRGGINAILAGLCDASAYIKCSREVNIKPDISVSEAKDIYDILILPGGFGSAQTLSRSAVVGTMLKEQEKQGKWIAAACSAPTALLKHGIALGKKVTSNPRRKTQLEKDYQYIEDGVVVDGKLITSQGVGVCFIFALTVVEQLVGKDKASEIAKEVLVTY